MLIPLDILLNGLLDGITDDETPTFFATWQKTFGTTDCEVVS